MINRMKRVYRNGIEYLDCSSPEGTPCDDCHVVPHTRTYGLGHIRCELCALMFDEANRARRQEEFQRERAALKAHIDAGCPDDGIVCEDCCAHEFDSSEGYMCIECGADGMSV